MDINAETIKLATLLGPWALILFSISVTLWIKDFATGLAKGIKFQMNPAFREGDKVILDGRDAIIVKIGISETVFGTYSDRGYTWRFVPNEKISTLKLEKIINSDLHMDTDSEKGRRIQKLIDKAQDSKINNNTNNIEANREAIEKLKDTQIGKF